MTLVLSRQQLDRLVDSWLQAGTHVAGPVRVGPELILYQPLAASTDLLLDGFIRPANSIKQFIFPQHEKLYGYRLNGNRPELLQADPLVAPQVIVGARPCDAASLPILDHVFHWDYEDQFYIRRRLQTTVITLACRQFDEHCFCTSLGLGPESEQGSDVILFDLGDNRYEVRCLTEKGEALLAGQTEDVPADHGTVTGPPTRVDLDAVQQILAGDFENPVWQTATLRCLGCGACTYHCPTCHCFDIVDERAPDGGHRVRNWDTCQAAMFTMHASGHNPRSTQSQRQRQRIYHKYRIYPDKFGVVACTGCGNCTRNCPVSLGIRNVLGALQDAPAGAPTEAQP